MKRFIVMISLILLSLSSLSLEAKPPQKDKHETKQKIEKKKKQKKLPPGLKKKLERGGELPPGWQKKLVRGEILDERVYRHAHRVELTSRSNSIAHIEGTIVVRVDDRLIRLYEATREIVDILK